MQRAILDTVTNKISFLFLGARSVSFNPAALLPSGSVFPNASNLVPFGFLLCDGSPVSRATYTNLFNAISTAHGDGTKNADGTNSIYSSGQAFNLPDYRGRFLRGVDGSAGRDANKATRTAANTGGSVGNSVGSVQANETKINGLGLTNTATASLGMSANATHTHSVGGFIIGHSGDPGSPQWTVSSTPYTNQTVYYNSSLLSVSLGHTHDVTPSVSLSGGGAESRPLNAYVNYMIKI